MFKRLIVLIMSMFLGGIAFASTTPNSVVTAQTPELEVAQFTASPNTYKNVYVSGSNGSKITGLWVTTNDPTGGNIHNVTCQLELNAGAVNTGGTDVLIPSASGFEAGAPPVNLMSSTNWPGLPIDSDGNPFIYMPAVPQTYLECAYNNALTASDVINVEVIGADF